MRHVLLGSSVSPKLTVNLLPIASELLGVPGITTRSKDATIGAPVLTTGFPTKFGQPNPVTALRPSPPQNLRWSPRNSHWSHATRTCTCAGGWAFKGAASIRSMRRTRCEFVRKRGFSEGSAGEEFESIKTLYTVISNREDFIFKMKPVTNVLRRAVFIVDPGISSPRSLSRSEMNPP